MNNKELTDRIDSLVKKNLKTYKITGASISIIDKNEILYTKGFGYADKKKKLCANSDTVFRIGSITKVFTALAIMQLVEKEKIQIGKPITDYIKEFSIKSRFENIAPVTIRDILSHHSGLPCDDFRNYFSTNPEDFKTVIDFLKHNYLIYPPGKMFSYSNLGFNLLGVVIERVSGQSYDQYIRCNILERINMSNSSILVPKGTITNVSKPYHKGKEQTELSLKYLPSGGILSTAKDMAEFMMSVINYGQDLFDDASTISKMFTPQFPDNPYDFNMNNGQGWFIGKPGLNHAGRVIWHDGGTPNYFSLTVMIPERQLGVTILTNSKSGALMNHLITIEILNLILESKYGIYPPIDDALETNDAINMILPEQSAKFFTLSGLATISREKNKFIAKLSTGTFRLSQSKDLWFHLIFLLFGFIPLRLKQLLHLRIGIVKIGSEKYLATEQIGFKMLQGKEYKILNSNDKWASMVGKYYCINDDNPRFSKIKLLAKKEGIFIKLSSGKIGKLFFPLDILSDSEAIVYCAGRYSGETIFKNKNTLNIFGLEFEREKQ